MPMIAVLDDDRKLWETYMHVLREVDIEVVQYVNKINFFLEPPRLKPDLIVTDIQSPKMDGYEFLELVRQDPEYRDVPIIVMTVAVDYDPACEPRALALGAFSVIPKCSGISHLIGNLEFALNFGKNHHSN